MTSFIQGVRALVRRLARQRGFALAVLGTLGLGVAANTVSFDLLYSYLLAPLPYPDPGQLVSLSFTSPAAQGDLGMSYPTYFDLLGQTTAMADAGMSTVEAVNLAAGSRVMHVRGAEISASLLTTLGLPPILGRLFGPEADQPGSASQVLLSERLWSRLFDRDPAAAGQILRINGAAYTVAGVMPERFQVPDPDTDLWLAKVFGPSDHSPGNLTAWGHTLIVRLAPGVTPGQLEAQAQAVLDREIAHFPKPQAIAVLRGFQMRMAAKPLRTLLLGDLSEHLVLAQLATGLLLLLIWFNLANLFIARALRQRGELVLRRVLGAETPLLFRELFTESLALCLAGGAVGLLLGEVATRALLEAGFARAALAPARNAYLVAGIALLLAVLSALVFSLASLYFIRRQDLAQALKEADARSAGGRGERRIRAALVITQLTIACVLTAFAAMLGHSLLILGAVEVGFRPERLVTFQIDLPAPDPGQRGQLVELHRVLASVPGVTAVTLASDLPFDGQIQSTSAFPYPFHGGRTPTVFPVVADPDFFATFGMVLRQGRLPALEGESGRSGPGEAVVDVQAAQDLFGTPDVVGRTLIFNSPHDSRPHMRFRVGAVVGTVRRGYLAEGRGTGVVYLDRGVVDPTAPWTWTTDTWYVAARTPLAKAAILPALQQAVAHVLPGVPVYDVRTMNERMSQQLASRRELVTLVLLFALGALAVASVGLYAVASYSVSQRRPELGIRAALGADPARLRQLVLREAGLQLLIGAPLGLAGAVILGRMFADSLYGVQPVDLPSLAGVLVVLAGTTWMASWVPAWQASKIPALEALRDGR